MYIDICREACAHRMVRRMGRLGIRAARHIAKQRSIYLSIYIYIYIERERVRDVYRYMQGGVRTSDGPP